jgi:exonuclease VII small subunit
MSDHIPDVTKMIGDTPRTDQMEQHAAVGLRRNAAFEQASDLCRQLERELNAANERIPLLIAERDTARRQADQNWKLREEFADLLGTDDLEQGVAVVRELQERIKRLEEDSQRLNWLLKRGLAWRDCYNDWWKEGEWLYASQSALETIDKAKEAKP